MCHLAGQVDQLLDPPHEVARGEVRGVEDLVEVVASAQRYAAHANARSGSRLNSILCSRWSCSRSPQSRTVSASACWPGPPGSRGGPASSARRDSYTSADRAAARPDGDSCDHTPCSIASEAT